MQVVGAFKVLHAASWILVRLRSVVEMSSAHGLEILSGNASKKPHSIFGHTENRYFVLKVGAGNVPELAYYDAQTADPAHMKGVLYFDNAGVVLKMHKDHGQLHLHISNASRNHHQEKQHVVDDLTMIFSTVVELETWNQALQNCLNPNSHVGQAQLPATKETLVLILGSTGEVGSVLTKYMVAKKIPVRLGVRSVGGKSAGPGVEYVRFDWSDTTSHGNCLAGVSAVVIIYPLQKGMVQDWQKFLPALKAANVPHVVKMSAAGIREVPASFNFEAGEENKTVDDQLLASGLSCSIVAPTFFATNALRFQSYTMNDHGAFYGSCGDAPTAYVAIQDIAEALAACATHPALHRGKTYTVTGPVALKESECAKLISQHLGKQINYVDIPEDNFVQANLGAGVPQWNVAQTVCLEKMKRAGITAKVSSDTEKLIGRPATSFIDAIKHQSLSSPEQDKHGPKKGKLEVCVLIGYGLGAADAVLDGFLAAGFTVAIAARTMSKLQAAATQGGRQNVHPFAVDLSKPEQVQAMFLQVQKQFGGIDVVVYNATTASFSSYDAVPVQACIDAAMVNQASLWAAYYAVLPFFKAAGKGAFLTTGGGLSGNGAYAVPFGFQLGAPTKSYMKNFAEAMHATHSQAGIRVINMNVSSLLYGGDNVTIPDPNSAKSAKYRVKLGKMYVEAATGPIPENVDVLVNDEGCDA